MFAHVLSLVTPQGILSLPGLLVGLVFASVFLLTFAIMRAVLVRSEIKRRTLLPILATSQDARSLRHSETIAVETDRPISPAEARELFAAFPGIVVVDDPVNRRFPVPLDAAGRDEVFVGRIRRDPTVPHGLNLWVVSDNLRKGAATNAVQIAEVLVQRGWQPRN